jgi:hypothetical protein
LLRKSSFHSLKRFKIPNQEDCAQAPALKRAAS